jgi:nitrogenase subunit NifH
MRSLIDRINEFHGEIEGELYYINIKLKEEKISLNEVEKIVNKLNDKIAEKIKRFNEVHKCSVSMPYVAITTNDKEQRRIFRMAGLPILQNDKTSYYILEYIRDPELSISE